jgi:DnaJ-class molecular chaperone
VQLGPGMFSQSNGICDVCNGLGEEILESDKCKKCLGEKSIQEKKEINVKIDKGAPDGQRYTFHGEGHELVFLIYNLNNKFSQMLKLEM